MNLKVKAAAIMAGIFAGTIAVQGVLVLAAEKYGTQAIVKIGRASCRERV